MRKFKVKTFYKKLLADTITPVSIYLRLRDKFPNSILLESSDYQASENSFSFICCNPIASFKVEDGNIEKIFPDGEQEITPIKEVNPIDELDRFINTFEIDSDEQFSFNNNGLFGYITYDAVKYFDDIKLDSMLQEERKVPEIYYNAYRFIIAINHFKDELFIFDHQYCQGDTQASSEVEKIEYLIRSKDFPVYNFSIEGEEKANFTDEEFAKSLEIVKTHNHRGDTFQMVLSRRYSQEFKGDEFNVYRALRSINPSPYLFYFDFGNFKIFGSSPEAQIVIKDNKATIYPIAGTFKRTGNIDYDIKMAAELKADPKESAEHVMLVDLARNDLSRNCTNVTVDNFKETQFYSHVIHLVSKVSGIIKKNTSIMKLVGDTFPAGTLSGAPKYKAMQLIDKYEKGARGYYGGCIGFIGFNGYFNHAIMIRSFLSKDNLLYYQAGAGVVADSVVDNELKEVNNKLMALKSALKIAEELA